METKIRQADESDKKVFIDYSIKLSKFNRVNHNNDSKYDDYSLVIKAIKKKAEETFKYRNENTLILIAEIENKPVGYALGRIYKEDETADNGTGEMGLLDELFIEDRARGAGLGQKLLNEAIKWMKEKGIKRIKLHAYSWNDNAIKLYERNGFKEYVVSYETFI
ncbi:MAG: GNAT family N-acetyltransferase [Firmicutes bacterium]|nr:GNAT family N-acetyltransferase [Bacillota bacterium]